MPPSENTFGKRYMPPNIHAFVPGGRSYFRFIGRNAVENS